MLSSQPLPYLATERLLCLSNGHGEDIIAVRILQALQKLPNAPKLAALPLVGEGRAYQQLGIPLIGPVKAMPSGGFIYMDGRQFARDLQGGLLQLTLAQFRGIRQWAKQGGSILAVGDIVPLLLAYLSGAPYAFIGTAKSEYYLRDEAGRLFPNTFLDAWSGSVYYPWERWMMGHPRCHAVFPRDTLTTKVLQKWSIPAFDLGNPMMDGLEPQAARSRSKTPTISVGTRFPENITASGFEVASAGTVPLLNHASSWQEAMKILLLPGSRTPEAYENWQLILQAVDGVQETFSPQPLVFLGAIAASVNLEPLVYALTSQGWKAHNTHPRFEEVGLHPFPDENALWFTRGNATLGLSQHAYADCLHLADWAIAMAGTATEQFVGLGKAAIIFPGKGPQFTQKFAEAQTRLLGRSVILVSHPSQTAKAIQNLLQHSTELQQIAENGDRRMGQPGAAERIAECLMQQLKAS